MNAVFSESSSIAKGRSRLYLLLSAVFKEEASPKLLEILRSEEIAAILSGLGAELNGILNPPEGDKALLEALEEEYAALFVLPGGVSPYESVKIKGQLCQDPEWKAREFYQRCGVTMQDSRIFSDHIGMELNFMGFMAGKEAQAWAGGDEGEALRLRELEREFFVDHINNWAFKFFDDLDKYAFHPFYLEASKLSRSFLEAEKQDLNPTEERPAGIA